MNLQTLSFEVPKIVLLWYTSKLAIYTFFQAYVDTYQSFNHSFTPSLFMYFGCNFYLAVNSLLCRHTNT